MQTSQTNVSDVYSENYVFWWYTLWTCCERLSSLTLTEFLNFSIWMKFKLSDIFNRQKPILSSGYVKNFNIPAKMICPWGCLLAKSTFYCPCIPQFSTALESLFFTVKFDAKRNFWFPCQLFGEMIQKPLLLNRDNNAKHLVLPYSVLCLDKHLLAWHKVRTVGWHK